MHYFLKFILGTNLYMFRTVPLSIIRSFSLYTQQWYMSYSFADSLRAGSGWNQRNCPKHVGFHSKINLSASSWFYYKKCDHDAWSHGRQICRFS